MGVLGIAGKMGKFNVACGVFGHFLTFCMENLDN